MILNAKPRQLTLRLAALLSSLLLVAVPLAHAQTTTTTGTGQGLEISPPTIELSTDPGKSLTTSIKLRNVTSNTLLVKAQADDFVADGEDGTPKILLDATEASSFTLKQYVQAIPDFKLAANEQKAIEVKIDVPDDASPGGHYGTVRFSGTPEATQGAGVSLSASIGSLVLLKVSGDVKQDLSVSEFSAASRGKKGGLFESGPVTVTERLTNGGNVHLKPQGEVRITNLFGQEVAKLAVNDKGGNILPQSMRKFEQEFSKRLLFGRYTANLNVHYDGQTGCLLTESVTFWVIPYKAVGIGLILLLVILLVMGMLRHRGHKDIGSSLDNDPSQPGPFDDNHSEMPPSIPTNPQL